MSYKDLEEARAKRATKETARAAKGKAKRGRKRKSATTLEAEAPEPKAKMARISKAPVPVRASAVLTSGTQVAEDNIVPEPWRAPVARMYERRIRLPHDVLIENRCNDPRLG
jgi:hypothetical protein